MKYLFPGIKLKDLVERKSEKSLSDDEIRFMRDYGEKFIMRIVNPSQKTLLNDKLFSEIELFVRQNPSLVPLQLGFDIIPILKIFKSQLESRKLNDIESKKSMRKMMLNEIKEIRLKKLFMNKLNRLIKQGSGWVIQLVDKQYLNIVHYTPMKGSSYTKLTPEQDYHMKGLINLQIRTMNVSVGATSDCFIPMKLKIRRE